MLEIERQIQYQPIMRNQERAERLKKQLQPNKPKVRIHFSDLTVRLRDMILSLAVLMVSISIFAIPFCALLIGAVAEGLW